jgi:D-glycero-D-manno-heptose 1,7-bisphosphate phosphatase
MNKAAFLDRDGVINRKAPHGGYITRWEDMQFLPGVAEAIGLLNRAGFLVIVITNQRCVAKGLITPAELETMHETMRAELARAGSTVDGVYYCPHELEPPCTCRKPRPGLLLEAARVHDLDLAGSWMIGDSDIDVEAGRSAGCNTARLLGSGEIESSKSDLVAQSLIDATRRILEWGDAKNASPIQR